MIGGNFNTRIWLKGKIYEKVKEKQSRRRMSKNKTINAKEGIY